jgi:hypothetical protein
MLARWMLDHHKSLQPAPMTSAEVARTLVDPLNSFFPDVQPSASSIVAPPRFADSRPAEKPAIAARNRTLRR